VDYVFVVAVIAILVGVFVVSTGRGGELAYERADAAPLDLGPVSATDVALLRPPTALWGYNMQVTDEALERIARAMRDRDVQIAYLERQLSDQGLPPAQLPGQEALPLQYAPPPLQIEPLHATEPPRAEEEEEAGKAEEQNTAAEEQSW
jgi:hypothetical protein